MGFGKEGCKISGRYGVVPELKETLASPHLFWQQVLHRFSQLYSPFRVSDRHSGSRAKSVLLALPLTEGA